MLIWFNRTSVSNNHEGLYLARHQFNWSSKVIMENMVLALDFQETHNKKYENTGKSKKNSWSIWTTIQGWSDTFHGHWHPGTVLWTPKNGFVDNPEYSDHFQHFCILTLNPLLFQRFPCIFIFSVKSPPKIYSWDMWPRFVYWWLLALLRSYCATDWRLVKLHDTSNIG